MQKKIPVKTLYLLLVISIGLIGLGVGSTFAMFTATAEIDNPISLTYSLDYGYDVIETVEATVSANTDRTITLNITNSTSSNLNYTCFYITSNNKIELGTDLSHNTIGTINAGATIPLNVTIRNNTSSEETIVIGVLSNKESITLSEEMRVIPNKELPAAIKNASEMISNLFSKTGTVTNNGITYDIDATHGLIDTSMMYKDLGDSVVVYRGDIDCNGEITEDESTYILYHSFFGDTDYPLNTLIADVNGDGELTDADAVYAQNIANGEAEKTIVSIPKTSYGATSCILNEKVNQEIRYYGQEPDNYINIGDNVLWRIIGVFDGKLKLIRSTYITSDNNVSGFSWDTSASTVTSGLGINEWSQADLMKLLNPGYENNQDLNSSGATITVNNSLWYNSQSGTCYTGQRNATKSCNFTNSGLSDSVKDKIAEVTWNTGGWNTASVYPNLIYEKERGTTVISSPSDGITRTTSWTGKIGLAYPSDYGYATDLQECNQNLNNYDSSTNNYACRGNNWMWRAMTGSTTASSNGSNVARLLTPNSSLAYYAWIVDASGYVDYSVNVCYAFTVSPVLYLNSEQAIESGSGTSSDPYVLAN